MKTYDPTTGDCTPAERAAYVEGKLISLRLRLSSARLALGLANNDVAQGRTPITDPDRARRVIASTKDQIDQYEDELVLLYGE